MAAERSDFGGCQAASRGGGGRPDRLLVLGYSPTVKELLAAKEKIKRISVENFIDMHSYLKTKPLTAIEPCISPRRNFPHYKNFFSWLDRTENVFLKSLYSPLKKVAKIPNTIWENCKTTPVKNIQLPPFLDVFGPIFGFISLFRGLASKSKSNTTKIIKAAVGLFALGVSLFKLFETFKVGMLTTGFLGTLAIKPLLISLSIAVIVVSLCGMVMPLIKSHKGIKKSKEAFRNARADPLILNWSQDDQKQESLVRSLKIKDIPALVTLLNQVLSEYLKNRMDFLLKDEDVRASNKNLAEGHLQVHDIAFLALNALHQRAQTIRKAEKELHKNRYDYWKQIIGLTFKLLTTISLGLILASMFIVGDPVVSVLAVAVGIAVLSVLVVAVLAILNRTKIFSYHKEKNSELRTALKEIETAEKELNKTIQSIQNTLVTRLDNSGRPKQLAELLLLGMENKSSTPYLGLLLANQACHLLAFDKSSQEKVEISTNQRRILTILANTGQVTIDDAIVALEKDYRLLYDLLYRIPLENRPHFLLVCELYAKKEINLLAMIDRAKKRGEEHFTRFVNVITGLERKYFTENLSKEDKDALKKELREASPRFFLPKFTIFPLSLSSNGNKSKKSHEDEERSLKSYVTTELEDQAREIIRNELRQLNEAKKTTILRYFDLLNGMDFSDISHRLFEIYFKNGNVDGFREAVRSFIDIVFSTCETATCDSIKGREAFVREVKRQLQIVEKMLSCQVLTAKTNEQSRSSNPKNLSEWSGSAANAKNVLKTLWATKQPIDFPEIAVIIPHSPACSV